jgi:hypothetical protein
MKSPFNKPTLTIVIVLVLIIGSSTEKPTYQTEQTEQTESIDSIESKLTQQQRDVKATVENFLILAGNYDLEAMDEMISEKASIGISSYKNEEWKNSVITFAESFEAANNRELLPYYEPVSEWDIQINKGQKLQTNTNKNICLLQ